MKRIRGIWFPDDEKHLIPIVTVGPEYPPRSGKGTYQFHKYQHAMKYVRQRRHAVDVGGHVGLWARVLSHDFDRVTIYEPHPRQIECLAANMADRPNWTHHQVALGQCSGIAYMNSPKDNTGNSHIEANETGPEVLIRSLDSFKLKDIDLLKIDVEGYEYEVVLGAKETILREKPVIVIEQKPKNAERYGRRQTEASELLREWGAREAAIVSGDHIMVWA